jgi:hypothetical protein
VSLGDSAVLCGWGYEGFSKSTGRRYDEFFSLDKGRARTTKRCNHHRRIVAVCCPELGEFIQ